ncbi:MAG TPA: hypothetical protein DDY16_03530 [Tenacibaculum sp.]|nr:hypothetical protein [Tenacibaculum sp.]
MTVGGIEALHSDVLTYETAGFSTQLSNAICLIPNISFLAKFSFFDLLSELNFDKKLKSGRSTQLFGQQSYNYGPITHLPTPFNPKANPAVCEIFDFVSTYFPDFKLNSCLINYYPNNRCYIPDHSDDESGIADDSFIVTLSFGSDKKMFFKDKISTRPLCSVKLKNGMFLIFSKNSQFRFTHGIPAVSSDSNDYSPRISCTFRNLI